MRAALDQLLGQGAVEHARQRTFARAAQYQGGHIVVRGVVEQRVGHAGSLQHFGIGAKPSRQRERAVDLALRRFIGTPALHGHHRPRRIAALGREQAALGHRAEPAEQRHPRYAPPASARASQSNTGRPLALSHSAL